MRSFVKVKVCPGDNKRHCRVIGTSAILAMVENKVPLITILQVKNTLNAIRCKLTNDNHLVELLNVTQEPGFQATAKFSSFVSEHTSKPIRAAMSEQGITTYSVEYREKPGAKCAACSKSILAKSLAASEIYRKSKTEKKKFAKHTWYHFKCWTVPDMVTKLPIEQLRGYPSLVEKDQRLVKQLIERGAGAKWEGSSDRKKEEEEPVDTEKPAKKKEKKSIKSADLTSGLTGVQVAPEKNVTKLASNAGKKRKAESIDKKKDEAPKEEPSLGKKDMLELENIAKEIQDALQKSKKAKK